MSVVKEMVNQALDDVITRQQAQPVAVYEPAQAPASPLDLPAEAFKAGLARRRENRAALMDWIREALVEGTDYGRIHVVSKTKCPAGGNCKNPHHWSKPSLFKPGAEKICGMLGVTVHYPNLTAYEQAALSGASLAAIIMRCELRDSQNRVVAEGIGARNMQQDHGDLNKSLKMASKSAHIDATLRMAGLSEVFTQDLEDRRRDEDEQPAPQPAPAPAKAPEKISEAQHRLLEAKIRELGLDRERVKTWVAKAYRVQHFPDLHPVQFERLLTKLDKWAAEEYAQAESMSEQFSDAHEYDA